MKKAIILTIYLLGLIFLLIDPAFCQNSSKYIARIKVNVSAENEIKTQIESYLKRELRSLSDVLIVEDIFDWELNVVALEAISKAGNKRGVVLSVVIIRPFDLELSFFPLFLPALARTAFLNSRNSKHPLSELTKQEWEAIEKGTDGLYGSFDHWLRIGDSGSTKSLCEEIIADFDTKYLERQRQLFQQATDNLRKLKNSWKNRRKKAGGENVK